MRRLFWVALGATAGVLIARKVTRTAEALTPQSVAESLAESIGILGEAIRDFAIDVRAGMRDRETQLSAALGLDLEAPPEPLVPGSADGTVDYRPGDR